MQNWHSTAYFFISLTYVTQAMYAFLAVANRVRSLMLNYFSHCEQKHVACCLLPSFFILTRTLFAILQYGHENSVSAFLFTTTSCVFLFLPIDTVFRYAKIIVSVRLQSVPYQLH